MENQRISREFPMIGLCRRRVLPGSSLGAGCVPLPSPPCSLTCRTAWDMHQDVKALYLTWDLVTRATKCSHSFFSAHWCWGSVSRTTEERLICWMASVSTLLHLCTKHNLLVLVKERFLLVRCDKGSRATKYHLGWGTSPQDGWGTWGRWAPPSVSSMSLTYGWDYWAKSHLCHSFRHSANQTHVPEGHYTWV